MIVVPHHDAETRNTMREANEYPVEMLTSERRDLEHVREITIDLAGELSAASSHRACIAIDAAIGSLPAIVRISVRRIERARWDGVCLLVDAVRRRRSAGAQVQITDAGPRLAQLLLAAEHVPAFA
jgi:ABC-type transporter Mla MlaB component